MGEMGAVSTVLSTQYVGTPKLASISINQNSKKFLRGNNFQREYHIGEDYL
jgi:hypothetical protein